MTTVADLYRDSLVLPGDPKAIPSNPAPAAFPWPFLGGNKKQILVVVQDANTTHLPDGELNFLTRMLTPCKLTIDDVAIINMHHYDLKDYKGITGHFNSNKVLLFGLSPLAFGLPVQFPEFQVQAFQKIEYLSVPDLTAISKDEILKRKCWECLKKIFNLGNTA